jgi:hypothetical protein
MNNLLCPVCGYPNLDYPAMDPLSGNPSFDICPSCGCEFGYDDATIQVKDSYRKRWIKNGAVWFKPELKPQNWSLRDQLELIGIKLDKILIE